MIKINIIKIVIQIYFVNQYNYLIDSFLYLYRKVYMLDLNCSKKRTSFS